MASKIFRDDLLAGQVALVTGGATGIGARIAMELSELGAKVVIASRNQDRLARAASAMNATVGGEIVWKVVDIRLQESVDSLLSFVIERFGRLDVLVNNGGGQFFSPASKITKGGFDAVVATNLSGTWQMIRAAADAWMSAHGGCIINITMLTERSFPGMAHSVAARAGVESLTRTLAVEWAANGIRLNCVAPGYVASSGMKRYPFEKEWLRGLQSHVPLKRLASLDETSPISPRRRVPISPGRPLQ